MEGDASCPESSFERVLKAAFGAMVLGAPMGEGGESMPCCSHPWPSSLAPPHLCGLAALRSRFDYMLSYVRS